MKRLISLFALIAIVASNVYGFTVNDLRYEINPDGTSVTVYGSPIVLNTPVFVVIPESVEYSGVTYSVTSIGDLAFYGHSDLSSISIPKSVTSIGSYAFCECSGLTKVEISDLAAWCRISFVAGYSNPLSYANHLYLNDSEIKDLVIPSTITTIKDYAFEGCSGLTTVTIPNSVTEIGRSAFGCSGLTGTLTIPNTVTSIGGQAFWRCSGLTSVNWNAKNCSDIDLNTSFGSPFEGLTGIKTFTFGNEVERIPANLCRGLSGSLSVTIPNSVTSIGEHAFRDCSGMISVTIPNSVTEIGDYAFSGCSGLTSVNWNAKNCSVPLPPFNDLTGITTFNFGNEVEIIPAYLCSGLSGLTSVEIPNSVTSIGYDTFRDCSGLTSVTIGNSVTEIDYAAFKGCNNIETLNIDNNTCAKISVFNDSKAKVKSVALGNSVTSIGDGAFSGCSGLTTATIGNSVTSIGNSAFENCSGLTKVEISDLAAWCGITFGNETANPLYYAHHLYMNDSEIKDLVIPSTITTIKDYAFEDCSGLTTVTIPNSVTDIGRSAFYECSGLTSVTIGNSVTSIGTYAFADTPWYNNQPDGLIYVGKVAYKYKGTMPSGTSISIKEGTVSISPYCFYKCSGLTSVTIPNSVTSIGNNTFFNCSGLTSIEIPNSVTEIGGSAFEWCFYLTSVTIPNSVTKIGSGAFSDCHLTSVTNYALTPQTIDDYVFRGADIANCKLYVWHESRDAYNAANVWKDFDIQYLIGNDGLLYVINSDGITVTVIGSEKGGSVIIPESVENSGITYPVTAIGNGAFKDCSSLTSVTIPNSVTTIGERAFHGCSGLTSVTWNAKTCNDFSEYSAPFKGLTGIKTFTFGNEVEKIPAYLCDGLSGLTSIEIPNSVTSIGERAFSGCNGLTNLVWSAKSCSSNGNMSTGGITAATIGNEVEILPDNFLNGSKITEITIPSSVTTIGNSAFYGCGGLTSATIPNSVTSIGSYAFKGCSGLTSVTIPNSVTEINDGTFEGCSGLTSIDIPNSVTSIGNYAFYHCSGLTSVTIPNLVTSIGRSAFSGCSGLTSVTIPNSVTSIDGGAFSVCSGLTSVTIGSSVTSIGRSAFYGCSGLTSVNWNAKNCSSNGNMSTGGITSATIGNEVEILPDYFLNDSKITEITIPNSVTSIGFRAFAYCSGLASVTIPNSVTSIGYDAFYGCSSLTSVTIGNSVTEIGNYAFYYCWGLTSVTNYTLTPQTISSNVFDGVNINNCKLYVWHESLDAYMAAETWRDFDIQDLGGVEGVEVDEATKEVEGYYNLQGIRLNEPARGQVNIVRYTDGTAKKVVVK